MATVMAWSGTKYGVVIHTRSAGGTAVSAQFPLAGPSAAPEIVTR